MKKLTNLLLVLAMFAGIFAGGAVAFADDIVDGPNRPDKGNLTIHKYWLDNAVSAGTNGNGQVITKPDKAEAVKGIKFDIYKVGKGVSGPANKELPSVIPGGADFRFTYDLLTTPKTVSAVSATETYVYELETATYENYDEVSAADFKTAADGTLKFTGLAKGEYLVIEDLANSTGYEIANQPNATIKTGIPAFVVAVPMTVENTVGNGNTQWNKDVHVYPKNRSVDAIKDVNPTHTGNVNDAPTIGDELDFMIATGVPTNIENYKSFEIHDTLDNALTWYDKTAPWDQVEVFEAEVTTDGDGVQKITNKTPGTSLDNTNNQYYTVVNELAGSQTYKVKFTTEGLEAIKDFKYVGWKFTATINKNAVFDGTATDKNGHIIPNKGTVTFENEQGETGSEETNKTETPVAELEINKVDKDGNAITAGGAEFKISDTKDHAKKGKFIIVKKDGDKIVDVAYPDDTDYAAKQTNTAPFTGYVDYKVTTVVDAVNKTNTGRFVGLKDALDVWLVETKAPTGFNLMDEPVQVKAVSDGATPNTVDHITIQKVTNTKGFVLPSTGGPGLIALTVAGIVIVGLGIMVAMPKKRKDA